MLRFLPIVHVNMLKIMTDESDIDDYEYQAPCTVEVGKTKACPKFTEEPLKASSSISSMSAIIVK